MEICKRPANPLLVRMSTETVLVRRFSKFVVCSKCFSQRNMQRPMNQSLRHSVHGIEGVVVKRIDKLVINIGEKDYQEKVVYFQTSQSVTVIQSLEPKERSSSKMYK